MQKPDTETDFSVEEILELTGEEWGHTSRHHKLLAYFLRHKQAGTSDTIKAYNIATEVLGRPDDFDDQTDSIVRVEMFRLRKKLKQFSSKNPKYKISIPKSFYDVEISRKSPKEAAKSTVRPQNAAKFKSISAVLIAVSVCLAVSLWAWHDFTTQQQLNRVCSDHVPNIRLEFPDPLQGADTLIYDTIVSVAGQYSMINLHEVGKDCNKIPPDYILTVKTNSDEQVNRLSLQLIHSPMSESISSKAITFPNDNSGEAEIFSLIQHMGDLFLPYGIIARHATKQEWKDNEIRQNSVCQLATFDSFVTDSKADFKEAIQCLLNVENSGKATADTIALIGLAYVMPVRGEYALGSTFSHDTGRLYIHTAKAMELDSSLTAQFELYMEGKNPNRNSQVIRRIGWELENKFPNNWLIISMLAYHYAYYSGDWESGLRLSDYAKKITPTLAKTAHGTDVGYHLLFSPAEEAFKWCERYFSPEYVTGNVEMNSCARLAGRQDWIERTETFLLENGLENTQDRVDIIKSYRWDRQIENKVIEGLRMRDQE